MYVNAFATPISTVYMMIPQNIKVVRDIEISDKPKVIELGRYIEFRDIRKMASSSSSSSSPDSKSGEYTFKLYFYDEVDNKSAGKDYSMRDDELLQRLGKLIDTSEVIQEVMYYTNPLNGWQLYKGAVDPDGLEHLQGNMHHAYIVFGTDKWWWSVEKNDACVAIQRSKNSEFVRDKYYRGHRQTSWFTGIDCVKKKTGQRRTVKQLLEHIVARDYVNQKYHFLEQNCQHLADKIYAYL